MSEFRLLFVSVPSPLPIIDGYTLRIYNLISNLPGEWKKDIICLRPKQTKWESLLNQQFRNSFFIDSQNTLQGVPVRTDVRRHHHLKNLIFVPHCVYALNEAYIEEFENVIRCCIEESRYDAILVSGAYPFGFYFSRIRHQNIVCDVIDSNSLYLKNAIDNPNNTVRQSISLYYAYLYNARWEKKYLSSCNKLVVISERDKSWLSKTINRTKIHVIENGVDTDYFNPQVAQPGSTKGLVIFTGVMDYEPNHDAMVYCLKEIWPQVKQKNPQAKLKIIGRHPRRSLVDLAKDLQDVEVTGAVEDMRQAARGAMLLICPMRIGAGMKNKILEAFAMGIPVVSTSEGAEGIKFDNTKVGYIADNAADIAAYVGTLAGDVAHWGALSRAARNVALSRYSWQTKATHLAEVLLSKTPHENQHNECCEY